MPCFLLSRQVGTYDPRPPQRPRLEDGRAGIYHIYKRSDSAPLYALIILFGGAAALFGLLYIGLRLPFG
jgi:hypothetical protein